MVMMRTALALMLASLSANPSFGLLSNLPAGEAADQERPPILVVADWLGTLAHGGTVTLPAKR